VNSRGYINGPRGQVSDSAPVVVFRTSGVQLKPAEFGDIIANADGNDTGAAVDVELTLPDVGSVKGQSCRFTQIGGKSFTIRAPVASTIAFHGRTYRTVKVPDGAPGGSVTLSSDGLRWFIRVSSTLEVLA